MARGKVLLAEVEMLLCSYEVVDQRVGTTLENEAYSDDARMGTTLEMKEN